MYVWKKVILAFPNIISLVQLLEVQMLCQPVKEALLLASLSPLILFNCWYFPALLFLLISVFFPICFLLFPFSIPPLHSILSFYCFYHPFLICSFLPILSPYCLDCVGSGTAAIYTKAKCCNRKHLESWSICLFNLLYSRKVQFLLQKETLKHFPLDNVLYKWTFLSLV